MIGEPEIDGDWHTASGSEGAAEALPGAGEPERDRVRSTRRPWLWALGGAVAASAVWAGTLAVQDRSADTPRIDYRHSANLCRDAPLKLLTQVAGKPFESNENSRGESPAQDWASCRFGLMYEEDSVSYGAHLLVELHKRTDPGPEFATGHGGATYLRMDPAERREVPGLGDRAVLDRTYMGDGDRLIVLDGGAVFTLTVEWYRGDGEGSGVDVDAIEAAMIEDVRMLMAALRR
ncbi:hypothetical protein [Streptomyces sp. NBC_01264]|uniref:hypothetical protein n=1 Tax=Streptomyces sp. NBC_01264 TaxID=2903804 RepID=UPI002251607D|nr:hypothetical protein [Streptomyces sp. NBC_01264]MCX4780746.1 hypothetical protein [Streptomyces sp. NBC_01264]